jgi:hypothetical protein
VVLRLQTCALYLGIIQLLFLILLITKKLVFK